jgi:chromosome segregation ATPase
MEMAPTARSLSEIEKGAFRNDAESAKEYASALERAVRSSQRIGEAIKSEINSRKTVIEQLKDQASLAKDQLAGAKRGVGGLASRFEQLTGGQQAWLTEIGQKIAGGYKPNKQERRRLEKLGFGAEPAGNAAFDELSPAAKAGLRGLEPTEFRGLDQAKKNVDDFATAVRGAESALRDMEAEIRRREKDEKPLINKAAEARRQADIIEGKNAGNAGVVNQLGPAPAQMEAVNTQLKEFLTIIANAPATIAKAKENMKLEDVVSAVAETITKGFVNLGGAVQQAQQNLNRDQRGRQAQGR